MLLKQDLVSVTSSVTLKSSTLRLLWTFQKFWDPNSGILILKQMILLNKIILKNCTQHFTGAYFQMLVNGVKWPSVHFHCSPTKNCHLDQAPIFFFTLSNIAWLQNSKFHELKILLQMSIQRNWAEVYVSPWFFLLFYLYFVKSYIDSTVFWYETAKSAKLIWLFLLWALADLACCYVNNDTMFLCSPASVFISTCCHSLGVYFVTQGFPKKSRFNINILPDTHEMACLRSFPVAGREEGCCECDTDTEHLAATDLWVSLLLKLLTDWLTDWSHGHFLVTVYLRCAGGKPKTVFFKQTVSLWNTSWSIRDAVDPMSCWDQMLPRHETLGLNITVTEQLVFMPGQQCIIKVPVLARK